MKAAIQLHANVFYFMYERSYYPSYDLQQLLANDVKIDESIILSVQDTTMLNYTSHKKTIGLGDFGAGVHHKGLIVHLRLP